MADYSNFETELLQKMLVKTQANYNTWSIKIRNTARGSEPKQSHWAKLFRYALIRDAIVAELTSRGVAL
jgi:hypothetical protein